MLCSEWRTERNAKVSAKGKNSTLTTRKITCRLSSTSLGDKVGKIHGANSSAFTSASASVDATN
jgi:hypothetical protein